MGIKIDLPIHDLEEANILAATLEGAITHFIACSQLINATHEEVADYYRRAEVLRDLRARLTGAES